MSRKIASLIAICSLSIGLTLSYFASNDPSAQALRAFQRSRFEVAIAALAKVRGISSSKRDLYGAYIDRAKRKFERSDLLLHEANAQLSKSGKKEEALLADEIIANQLLNFYLQGQTAKFKEVLNQQAGTQKDDHWIALFQAIEAQQAKDHQRALHLFYKAQPLQSLSPWMKSDFDRIFSNNWKQLFQARSLLALGKTVKARQILQTLEKDSTSSDADEKRVLIALSYMQEARSESDFLAKAYFELASSYLDRQGVITSEGASDQIFEICLNAIQRGQIDVCGALIESLEQWQAKDQLGQLADALTRPWIESNRWPDTDLQKDLASLPPDFRANLDDRIKSQIEKNVEADQLGQMTAFYQNALGALFDKNSFCSEFENRLQSDLLQRIKKFYAVPNDETAMKLIDERLGAYTALDSQRDQAAQLVLDICDLTPLDFEKGAVKSSHFIKPFLEKEGDRQQLIAKTLQNHLQKAFTASWESRDFDAMSLQCQMVKELKLKSISNVTALQISAILGDAEFELEKNQIDRAIKRLEWILQVNPGNRRATEVIADALCQRKDFAKALSYISAVDSKETALIEKHIFCFLQLDQIDQALLAAKNIDYHLSDDALKNLGQEAYRSGYYQEAKRCLFRIVQPDQVIWRLRVCAAFRTRNYRDCWNSFCCVSEGPYSPKLAAIALSSLIELRADREGEQVAQKVAHWLKTDELRSEPAWEEALIWDVEPAAAIARFYRQRLQNFDSALQCLDLATEQSPQTLFERVRILLEKKQPKSALDWLISCDQPLTENQQLQRRALECRCLFEQGDETHALEISQQLCKSSYLPQSAKIDLVLALKSLQQWQSASALLADINIDEGWEIPLELHRLELLGELGHYQAGSDLIIELQKSDLPTWGIYERNLIGIMGLKSLIGSDQKLPLVTLPHDHGLTHQRCAHLALYCLDTGDFENARSMRSDQTDLGLSDEGASVLAALAYIDHRESDSACQIKRILRDPRLNDQLFARNAGLLARSIERVDDLNEILTQLLQRNEKVPSAKALYRLSTILLAQLTRCKELDLQIDQVNSTALKALEFVLSELISLNRSQPKMLWPFVHLGQLFQLCQSPKNAQSAFDAALSLNQFEGAANYGKSQNLSLDLNKRVFFAQNACCGTPQCADYWLALGALQIEQWHIDKSSENQARAKKSLTKANSLDPLLLKVYWCTAKFLLAQGQTESAQKLARFGFEKIALDRRQQSMNRLDPELCRLLNRPLVSADQASR